MGKIVEIQDYSFDLSNYIEGFRFLNFIFNESKYYYVFTDSLIFEVLDIRTEDYLKIFKSKNYSYSNAYLDLREAFTPFIKDLNYNNIFHHFLVLNHDSDKVKVHQVSHFLKGLEQIIEYYHTYMIYDLDFHYENKTINEEMSKKEYLISFLPSFVIFRELKNLYDVLWNDYGDFIDKHKFKYSLFYSNKKNKGNFLKTEKKEDAFKLSRKDLVHKLIGIDTKEQKQFEKYEERLISNNYLNDGRNSWLRSPAEFVRFYNYCENKNIFKPHLKKGSKGILWLRELYGFYDGKSLNSPTKRKKQNTKTTKFDFSFLDIN